MPTDGGYRIKQKFFCYMCHLFQKHSYWKGLCGRRNKYVKKDKEACKQSGLYPSHT